MTALASITQDWYNATDSGSLYNGVHVVFVDFRKAFDLVDHGVLLTKLAGIDITKSFWKWTHSYLSGRTQQYKRAGVLSRHGEVIAGVHQGGSDFTCILAFLLTRKSTSVLISSADSLSTSMLSIQHTALSIAMASPSRLLAYSRVCSQAPKNFLWPVSGEEC